MKTLGLTTGLKVRPLSSMSAVLLQLIVGSLNLVGGVMAMIFSVNVASTGVAALVNFLQISLLVFILGVLSFTTACLAAISVLIGRGTLPQPQPTPQTYDYSSQVTWREYVTHRRQTLEQQEWVGLACPDCGRNVSRSDNFCDECGAQFKNTSEPGLELQKPNVAKT